MTPPQDQLRAFVALTPDPPWTLALAQIQAMLDSAPGGQQVRWSKAAQIHLTLRFLGHISPAQSREAIGQLQLAGPKFPPFSLELSALDCFPNPRHPRIIWVGLQGAISSLLALRHSIAQALSRLGDHQEDKPFHPHLTLGRVKPGIRRPELVGDLLRNASLPRLEPWQVRSVHLMRSELNPGGAIHSVLFTQPLGVAPQPTRSNNPVNKDLQSP